MAGIGFELKKIYKKEGISHSLAGGVYSSVITLGPTVVVIVTIILLYIFLDMTNVGMYKRELLSNTILYVFIFSVMLTSPFGAVFSRYLADKFYTEEFDNILSSYYVGLLIVGTLAALMGLPIFLSLYFRGGVDLPFILSAYFLWMAAVTLFFSIIYLHATKDYKIIAAFFFIAMVIGGVGAWHLFRFTHWDHIHSIIYGLTIAFSIIAICEFAFIRNYFKKKAENYKECIQYLFKYKRLFFTNFFYILGLYAHNIVYWHTPDRLYIANTYISNMAYDMASCLAMFTSISTTVIFTVTAETEFHETYQKYMESIISGTYKLIKKNKKIMFRTLSQQVGKVFGLQIAITSVIFLILIIFGRRIGFSTLTMEIYPLLAIGYLGVFLMYCNIVYLFYFEDSTGSCITGAIFFIGTLVCTLFCINLPYYLHGAGLVAGMLMAWTFSYFRLRWLERNFEAHIFCNYRIINTMKSSSKGVIIYSKEK